MFDVSMRICDAFCLLFLNCLHTSLASLEQWITSIEVALGVRMV